MKIISSQHYLDWSIVESKIDALQASGAEKITLPIWNIGEIEGEEYAILADGHHTLAAARELDLEIEFREEKEPEGLNGETALEVHYMDGDYYDVETSDPAAVKFDLIW